MILQIANIVPCTEAEGPGRRFALWFQGCPLRCPGCCNPEYLPFKGGNSIAIADIVEQLVIVELKSVEEVSPLHKKQLQTYLKLTGMKLGLLINFNVVLIKNGIHRVANGMID